VPRVLVFGASGQVARELARAAWPRSTTLIMLGREDADFMRPDTLGPVVARQRPDLVIVAAAYTKVDAAEDDEDTATLVNATAPGAIACAAAALSVPVVCFSTDYVFDGRKATPYEETDSVGPINVYGRSKLAGERAVSAANSKHLILRTSWVYSAFGANFLLAMLKLARTRDEVSIVDDQHGCPTAAGDLARAVVGIAPRLIEGDAPWGTYHLAGGSQTTWHGFAEAVFSVLAARGMPRPKVHAVPSGAYPTKARRPSNGRLSSMAFERAFGIVLPGFEEAMPAVLDEALAALQNARETA
jgi:dTDP-4-dehydrorhamnose reductase